MNSKAHLVLAPLALQDLEQAVSFANASRQLLFPELYRFSAVDNIDSFKQNLIEFKKIYLLDPQGACFVIKDQTQIIGMIAYRAYDDRFNLNLAKDTVEIVKLFILPDYRKQGLASDLCNALLEHAKQQRIHHLYLHTHPFLPAAEYFWHKQGFEVIARERIQDYDTIHMLKRA